MTVFYVHPPDSSDSRLCVRYLNRRMTPMNEGSRIFQNYNQPDINCEKPGENMTANATSIHLHTEGNQI